MITLSSFCSVYRRLSACMLWEVLCYLGLCYLDLTLLLDYVCIWLYLTNPGRACRSKIKWARLSLIFNTSVANCLLRLGIDIYSYCPSFLNSIISVFLSCTHFSLMFIVLPWECGSKKKFLFLLYLLSRNRRKEVIYVCLAQVFYST